MKIEVKVSEKLENLPQEKYQKIKRAINMLRENGFEVEIIWGESEGADGVMKEINKLAV